MPRRCPIAVIQLPLMLSRDVHGAEQFGNHLVSVRGVLLAHLLDGGCEETFAMEDFRILGEEAEDKPGQKVVEVLMAGGGVPVGVVPEQFDVEAIEAAGGLDVEGVLADLFDRGDTRQWQKEAEVVVKIRVGASHGLSLAQILCLEGLAVGGEDEPGLIFGRGVALPQGGEGGSHRAYPGRSGDGYGYAEAGRQADRTGWRCRF